MNIQTNKEAGKMQKLTKEGPRICMSEHFRQPGTPENILFSGSGVNLKNGKEISFKVPDTISKKGLECIARNIKMHNIYHDYLVMELQELFE
jgi:hypothetical protein